MERVGSLRYQVEHSKQ